MPVVTTTVALRLDVYKRKLHDRLQANAHPIQIPIGAEEDFTGIIDLIKMKAEIYTNDLGTDIQETDIRCV